MQTLTHLNDSVLISSLNRFWNEQGYSYLKMTAVLITTTGSAFPEMWYPALDANGQIQRLMELPKGAGWAHVTSIIVLAVSQKSGESQTIHVPFSVFTNEHREKEVMKNLEADYAQLSPMENLFIGYRENGESRAEVFQVYYGVNGLVYEESMGHYHNPVEPRHVLCSFVLGPDGAKKNRNYL